MDPKPLLFVVSDEPLIFSEVEISCMGVTSNLLLKTEGLQHAVLTNPFSYSRKFDFVFSPHDATESLSSKILSS